MKILGVGLGLFLCAWAFAEKGPPVVGNIGGYLVGPTLEQLPFSFAEGSVTDCIFKSLGEISVYHCKAGTTSMKLRDQVITFDKLHVFYKANKEGTFILEYIYEGKTPNFGGVGFLSVRLSLQRTVNGAMLMGAFEILSTSSRVAVVVVP